MDGNGVVWNAQDPEDSQYHLYYAFIQQPDVAIASANLTVSDEDPVEGDFIDVSILVRNLTDYNSNEDITVRLYDGDPDAGGTQWGLEQVVSGGLAGDNETTVHFTNLIVPENAGGAEEETHRVYARLIVPGHDNPDNNTAHRYFSVHDNDTEGPVISDIVVEEYGGDGDGIIGADEQVKISWNLADASGISTAELLVDGSPASLVGDYFAVVGPLGAGSHEFIINATDADNSSASSTDDGSFNVVSAEEITVIFDGTSIEDGDVVDAGTSLLDDPDADLLFIVRNYGEQALVLDSLVITTTQGTVSHTDPTPTSLASGDVTYFTITPDTTVLGPFRCEVSLGNSDSDENPFNFTITGTVDKVNQPPVLGSIGDQQVNELNELTFTATATDPDLPANTLRFRLDPDAPAGASIDPVTGVFTWTPTEAQGPANYDITVRVIDDGTPMLDDFETIMVTVCAAYDFGTSSSPVEPYYQRVTTQTAYNPTQGYGWLSGEAPLREVDRAIDGDLDRDFNYTPDRTFVVDVPNGEYEVTLRLGDLGSYAHDQMGVSLEGTLKGTVSTSAGQVLSRTYTTTVSDGQLTVRLRDLGGSDPNVVIEAMEVNTAAVDFLMTEEDDS